MRDRSLARAGLPHVMGISYAMVLPKRMRPIKMGSALTHKSPRHIKALNAPRKNKKCYLIVLSAAMNCENGVL